MIGVKPQLLEDARSGDRIAIEELLTRCQPDLKRFARRKCSNTEDAEDAVQIALLQIVRRVGTLRTVATLATWLFRIVERECYRLFRGKPATEPLDEVMLVSVDNSVPLNLQLDLARLIAGLPQGYREVLVMRDVEELSAAEVAMILNISVEAVKSRLHRARAIVREGLLSSGYWQGGPPKIEGRSPDMI